MRTKIVVLTLAVAVLSACDQKAWFDKFIPKEQAAVAKGYLASLQQRDFQRIQSELDPALRDPELPAKLAKMADMFPGEAPVSIDTVGANTMANREGASYNLTFQYKFSTKWLLANVAFREIKNGGRIIHGLNVYPLADSLENINAFRLEGKSPKHFAVLGAAIFVPLFVLYVLVLCIRTPISKRKWLWVLFILFPVGQLAFSWTDGSLRINPISFQMFGGGFFKAGPYAPVIIWMGIPVGAILFLLNRRKYLLADETANNG